MSNSHFGLQTYRWQMTYEKYRGRIDHIAGIGEQAGFIGLEAEVCMLDSLFPHVEQVREIMERHHMQFAALALPLNWAALPTESTRLLRSHRPCCAGLGPGRQGRSEWGLCGVLPQTDPARSPCLCPSLAGGCRVDTRCLSLPCV
jgi:hypothetical protein